LTQLFGDRLIVANATGCSSIYGGNLPTTPWSVDAHGRGPAWANSLFEDDAEFGLGMRLALDRQEAHARHLVESLASTVGEDLAAAILANAQQTEAEVAAQRERVAQLKVRLASVEGAVASAARDLQGLADDLVRRSVWIVGGDGWAYDIGSAGLDHVLASGRNVNVLVLDTEVYSNTGGQASKSTPRGALAKFAARGKPTGKKDLGVMATTYGNVYVAQVALGANDMQTVRALLEAEAWEGPSLIVAYSTCIAHGIDMATSMSHQKDAVRSGYWPLFRFNPGAGEHEHPFHLDAKAPSIPLDEFAAQEGRYALLARSDPEGHRKLMDMAANDVRERRRLLEQLVDVERTAPALPEHEDLEGRGADAGGDADGVDEGGMG
jgi:pyruvate-ferredoxin/flavodoxin oxidoreductase